MRQFVGQPTGEKRSVQKRIIHTYTQSESRKQKRDLFGEEVNKYPRAHCAERYQPEWRGDHDGFQIQHLGHSVEISVSSYFMSKEEPYPRGVTPQD